MQPPRNISMSITVLAAIGLLSTPLKTQAGDEGPNGSIVGWGSMVVGVDLSGPFRAIAAGADHSLGLKSDGSIVAWGDNYFFAQALKAEPPTLSKPEVPKDNSSDTVSLSVRADAVRDSTVLNVVWSGQRAESLLVVAVESAEAALRSREIYPGEIRLAGLVFVGRIGARGEASIPLPNESVSEFLGSRRGRIRVFVTQSVTVEFVREEQLGKSEGRIDRVKEISPADAAPKLRIFAEASDVPRYLRACPKTDLWTFEVVEREHLRVVIDCDDQRAFVEASATFVGGDSP